MLKIDTQTMLIELTRGDSANIVFSAVDGDGNTFVPSEGDELKFAVAKKVGAEPLFDVVNVMEVDADAFWTIEIVPENTNGMKFGDYVFDVQLRQWDSVTETFTNTDTIIGKTDTLSPTFRVWGEVATE